MYRNSYRSTNKGRFSNNKSRGNFSRRSRPSNGIHESHYVKKANLNQATEEVFVPKLKFSELPIHDVLKNNIVKHGYTTPSPIQDGAIMPLLEGKDVIGIADTGTGKTAAFLIPLIEKILKNDDENILIITPTRELAQQIQTELRAFTQSMRIYSALCIGGSYIRNQIYQVKRNPHFIIGTPGRLKDLIERKVLDLSKFTNIVLDEVDRMVDMGFIQDIRYLISLLPEKRQSLFFSATISNPIKLIIESFVKNPITVSVKKREGSHHINQDIVRVKPGEYKIDILTELLKQEPFKKVLIFGKTKMGVEKLSTSLYQKGFRVASIHGDKPQFKRQEALRLFKEGVVDILVATDVAARGIDVPNVTHVINYDQPASYEDYIHRIGRTGRANQAGQALTFV